MRKLLRRVITITICAALAFLLIVGIIAWFVHKNDPPSAADAPWAIKTSTRVFYAHEITMLQDGNPSMKGYWELNNGGYTYNDGILPLPKSIFGKVDVIRRPRE